MTGSTSSAGEELPGVVEGLDQRVDGNAGRPDRRSRHDADLQRRGHLLRLLDRLVDRHGLALTEQEPRPLLVDADLAREIREAADPDGSVAAKYDAEHSEHTTPDNAAPHDTRR